jgi:hypothetical protein
MPVPTIKPKTTGKVDTQHLDFDPMNPRLVEQGFRKPTDTQIIRALADAADLGEIIQSIASNGYIDIEPLIVRREKDRFIVLEGNRRLAAIRLLLDAELARSVNIAVPEIDKDVRESLMQVTVYAVTDAGQARNFIGFKHINGPHKWDAHAKGRFAADWYQTERKNGITLEAIAERLGDKHQTVARLVNGIYVLDQAEKARVFSIGDRYPQRKFAFSHLYTALTRPGYREYLGLPDEWRNEDPRPNPVPKARIENLKRVLLWLYGSKIDDIEPIITSQNPHIKQLGEVLQNRAAVGLLINRRSLNEAHAQIETKGARFEQALLNAKQEAETALSQVIGFDPDDETLLQNADELRRTSAALHTTMASIASQKPKSKK